MIVEKYTLDCLKTSGVVRIQILWTLLEPDMSPKHPYTNDPRARGPRRQQKRKQQSFGTAVLRVSASAIVRAIVPRGELAGIGFTKGLLLRAGRPRARPPKRSNWRLGNGGWRRRLGPERVSVAGRADDARRRVRARARRKYVSFFSSARTGYYIIRTCVYAESPSVYTYTQRLWRRRVM